MTIPDIVRRRLHDPEFWKAFFLELENDVVQVPDVIVEFPVGGGCQVVLEIQGEYDSYELGISTPTSGGVRSVGWDDQVHWHPFAFRWFELDLVCRAAAVLDPLMPHPGPALALLCRFTSIHDGDDVEQIASTVHAAFESLRPAGWHGDWPDAAKWLKHRDFRGRGISWIRDPSGHLYAAEGENDDGPPFYTMRAEPVDIPEAFPYEEWRVLLLAAETTIGRP